MVSLPQFLSDKNSNIYYNKIHNHESNDQDYFCKINGNGLIEVANTKLGMRNCSIITKMQIPSGKHDICWIIPVSWDGIFKFKGVNCCYVG